MNFQEIKKDWLLGVKSGYSAREISGGFDTVTKLLGQSFIENKWSGQRGIAVVNQIVGLGLDLKLAVNIKGFDKLKGRLLDNNTREIAVSELAAAASFARAEILAEFYPLNPDKDGELEMKLQTTKGEIIFVEVVSPKTQVWQGFLLKIINPIQKIAAAMQDIRLEIYLYDILNKEEQIELFNICKKIIREGKIGIEKHYDDKYHIFLSHADTIKIDSAEKKAEEQTSFFATNLTQSNGHKNLVTLGVPFADQRAEQILKQEYHQLTSSYPNIIIIDVSGVPKGMENWPTYIKRRFQPNINRKISAVMLRSSVSSKRIESEQVWILNPYAGHKLDQSFINSYCKINKQF